MTMPVNDGPSPLVDRIADLRRAFDRTFASPRHEDAEQTEFLLALRIAGDPYAIRFGEISGLAAAGRIVPLPTQAPELLGITGMKGGLIAVYGLAALLGYGQAGGQPGWLALCGTREPIGLAFHDYEGYLRVRCTQIYAAGPAGRKHIQQVARPGDAVRAVIDISSVVETINGRVAAAEADRAKAKAKAKE